MRERTFHRPRGPSMEARLANKFPSSPVSLLARFHSFYDFTSRFARLYFQPSTKNPKMVSFRALRGKQTAPQSHLPLHDLILLDPRRRWDSDERQLSCVLHRWFQAPDR
jgi:hypothetical protein